MSTGERERLGDAGPIRVVIVDDQAMLRGAFSALLDLEPDLQDKGWL